MENFTRSEILATLRDLVQAVESDEPSELRLALETAKVILKGTGFDKCKS